MSGVAIVVHDDGTGLDPTASRGLFDPFFTTKTTGTGIGLAISRNIIDGLGGAIALSSQPGTGTEVVIELPARSRRRRQWSCTEDR